MAKMGILFNKCLICSVSSRLGVGKGNTRKCELYTRKINDKEINTVPEETKVLDQINKDCR